MKFRCEFFGKGCKCLEDNEIFLAFFAVFFRLSGERAMEENRCSASEALLQVVRNRATEPQPQSDGFGGGFLFDRTGNK